MRRLVPDAVVRALDAGRDRGDGEGAVLLFDAEGSTRISSRLAEHGTAGAEALAETLTAVFTPIVEGVRRWGGFIAEFTGDGVMAVFPGPTAPATRAALAAAQAISAALSEHGTIATVAGDVTLNLRAIVGSGSVTWSVWSTDTPGVVQRRAFHYGGTALDEVQQGEPLVGGGAIAVGPRAATYLPEVRATVLPEGYLVLDRPAGALTPPGPSTGSVDAVQDPRAVDPPGFYPAAVIESPQRGEFREVVNLFATFVDDPPGALGPALLDLVAAHGGYLCDIVRSHHGDPGPTPYIIWGAPQAHEDDIERAVRFALELRELAGGKGIRAGITVGDAFAGFVGADTRGKYTAVGSVVNLAARMCASADWGEIRIGRLLARSLPASIETEPLGELDYAGFAEPVSTLTVVGEADAPATAETHRALLGRDREVGLLHQTFATLAEGLSPGIVAVSGEAGIGKTHLIDEAHELVRSERPETIWLRGGATEVARGAFDPIPRLLRERFGPADSPGDDGPAIGTPTARHSGDAVALARSHRTLLEFFGLAEPQEDEGVDPDVRFARTLEAVGDLLRAESAEHPLVLEIHDGHWLDASSLDFVTRLAADLAHHPVAFLIETREQLPVAAASALTLGPIDRSTTWALVEEALDAPPTAELVDLVLDRTGGNPFFVRQLIRYMREEGLLTVGPGGYRPSEKAHGIPDDLRRVIVARLDRLTADVRRAVMTGAILGKEFDVRVLSAMLRDDVTVGDAVASAERSGIWALLQDIRCLFRSSVLRDAAYAMHLNADLRRFHGAAADAMAVLYGTAGDAHAAELGHHLERAGRRHQAATQYRLAASGSADRYANAQALGYLEQAIELLDDTDPEHFHALLDMEALLDRIGERDRQRAVLDLLDAAAPPDPAAAFQRSRRRVEWLIAIGEYREALAAVEHVISVLTSAGHEADLAQATLQKAHIERYLGRSADAEATARLAARRLADADDGTGLATVDDLLGGLAWERGDFAASADHHRAAADHYRRLGRVQAEVAALNNLGSALFSAGDYAAARDIHTAGVERSREIGYRRAEGDHLDNRGGTAWAVGDYRSAVEDYEAALAIRRRMNDAWGIAISLGNLGATRRVIGEAGVARRLYLEALQVDRSTGRRRGEAYSLHGLGLVHRDQGEFDAAVECLEEAIALRVDLDERHLANESKAALADVLRRQGDLPAAATMAREALRSEGDQRFAGAVETTVSLMNCYRAIAAVDPETADDLLGDIRGAMLERAARISDSAQRESYLRSVAGHAEVLELSD